MTYGINYLKEKENQEVKQIKNRIKEKISIIKLCYDEYYMLSPGFNLTRAAIYMSYKTEKERVKNLEKYIDSQLEYFANNKPINKRLYAI